MDVPLSSATSGMEATALFSDEDLLDALLHVDPQIPELFPQGDDANNDEHGDSIDVLSTAESSASSPTALLFSGGDQSAPKCNRQKVTRSRQLSDMRAMANALESKLDGLKCRVYSERPEAGRFWERIAQRMLVERRLAMRENAQLRVLLRRQVASVRTLSSAFAQTPNLSEQLEEISPARYSPSVSRPKMPKKIYDSLLANVEASYSTLDDAFSQEARLLSLMGERRKVNVEMVSKSDLDLICVHVEETKVVPHGVVHAADQVWTYLSRVNEDERQKGFHRVFQKRDDQLFGECDLTCASNAIQLNGYVVLRRYVEENRVTMVWECVSTCEMKSNSAISLPIREKGWVFFDQLPEDSNQTIFRSCVHSTPQVLSSSSQALKAYAKDISYATKLIVVVYNNTVGYIYEVMLSSMLNGMRVT